MSKELKLFIRVFIAGMITIFSLVVGLTCFSTYIQNKKNTSKQIVLIVCPKCQTCYSNGIIENTLMDINPKTDIVKDSITKN